MTKTTIELNRLPNHSSGWGRVLEKYYQDAPVVLDALTEWSLKNVGKYIYKHRHFRVEENRSKNPSFIKTSYSDQTKVYKCDLVDYLEIYYQ